MAALVALCLAYTPALAVRSAASQHLGGQMRGPAPAAPAARRCAAPRQQQRQVSLSTEKLRLDDNQVEQLFAWLNMAFSGESRYNDLMLAFTCIFADHPPGSQYANAQRSTHPPIEHRPSTAPLYPPTHSPTYR